MVTTEQIKELRDKTGISVMQCQKALVEANGDMEKALFLLRKQSGEIARKKGDRELKSGVVHAYVHSNGSVGAIVELNCESDFVAINPEFKILANDIAMHITASCPEYLDEAAIPDEKKKEIEKLFQEEVDKSGKPEPVKLKMMEGKLSGYFKERTLLDQPFIKDQDQSVGDLIKNHIQKFGEKIAVARFARYSVLGK
jgi:elongation factor Ts